MKRYFALVEVQEGCAFGVRFPDLPSVFSAADDERDIVPNAVEALQLWAEDQKMPVPKTHADIMALPDVRDALKDGGYLIQIPFIDLDTAVVRANVTFERGLLRAIDDEAKDRGLTRSAFLASAARREIENRP